MNETEFASAVLAALDSEFRRVDGATKADVSAHTKWSAVGRWGRVDIDGVTLTIREGHDSTTGETWYRVDVPASKARDVTRGMTILTTKGDE